MIKTIKTLIMTLVFGSVLLVPAVAGAAIDGSTIDQELCKGANLDVRASASCANAGQAEDAVNNIIKQVINIFSIVVGVISVIMIIIGGLKYITSGGESGNVTSAKNTILYAVIGLVVVALAQIIVRFVLAKVTQSGS
jgi:cytochrome bd-type quinol oxidase subunit 2